MFHSGLQPSINPVHKSKVKNSRLKTVPLVFSVCLNLQVYQALYSLPLVPTATEELQY